MQSLVDIVTALTGTVRRIAGLFFLCTFGLGLVITAATTYVAPQAADRIADRAERVSDKAIEAARIEARNRANAEEGWGYSDQLYREPEFASESESDFATEPTPTDSEWSN